MESENLKQEDFLMMLSNVIQKISQLSKKEDFLIYEDNSLLKNVEIKNYETLTKNLILLKNCFLNLLRFMIIKKLE